MARLCGLLVVVGVLGVAQGLVNPAGQECSPSAQTFCPDGLWCDLGSTSYPGAYGVCRFMLREREACDPEYGPNGNCAPGLRCLTANTRGAEPRCVAPRPRGLAPGEECFRDDQCDDGLECSYLPGSGYRTYCQHSR